MKEKRKSKSGRNPKLDPAVYRYTVRFNEEEHNRFLAMFGKSGVYARSVFLKAHFFGQPFKVLKVDKTLVDYYTKLSDFHAQFRAVGTNYNQVVKELRLHFSEKKAMALLYKLEQHTVELVTLSVSGIIWNVSPILHMAISVIRILMMCALCFMLLRHGNQAIRQQRGLAHNMEAY